MPSRNRQKSCETCKAGDCSDCPSSPENSIPVKPYTPKGAARAMLAGKELKNTEGYVCFWDSGKNAFIAERVIKTNEGMEKPLRMESFTIGSFSGLYEELE
jgi:hypothetical protein